MAAADWQSEEEAAAEKRFGFLEAAENELDWYFGKAEGLVSTESEVAPELRAAALAIRRWLDELPTFYVGALELRFAPKEWPPRIVTAFGKWTSLVVRLECAMHPSETRRPTDELERAAVERIEEALTAGKRQREFARLKKHAREHARVAIRAYAKVRGPDECVLPSDVRDVL